MKRSTITGAGAALALAAALSTACATTTGATGPAEPTSAGSAREEAAPPPVSVEDIDLDAAQPEVREHGTVRPDADGSAPRDPYAPPLAVLPEPEHRAPGGGTSDAGETDHGTDSDEAGHGTGTGAGTDADDGGRAPSAPSAPSTPEDDEKPPFPVPLPSPGDRPWSTLPTLPKPEDPMPLLPPDDKHSITIPGGADDAAAQDSGTTAPETSGATERHADSGTSTATPSTPQPRSAQSSPSDEPAPAGGPSRSGD